ncbi:hypothetical protein V2J09_014720 [Rumex salicifolius]
MAAIRFTAAIFFKEILQSPHCAPRRTLFAVLPSFGDSGRRSISYSPVRCAASEYGDSTKKGSARLSHVQQLMSEAEERANVADKEPPPKITLVTVCDFPPPEHVSLSFARSGGPGGQNVNKVNTKVDMRFNVRKATWLSERVRERILQMEKNKINKDGELVISSTKTRTQQYLIELIGNIEDALSKLQVIIDAAAYVPPPPSEEQKKKIAKIAAISEEKRMHTKKALSVKKAIRRNRDSWG